MNYKLVPMDRSHLAGVAELERMCFSTPWNEAMLEEELYNDTASFIVAEGEDGSVLGYAGLHVILDEGYIDNVAVRPSCRRMGLGDRLLDVFIRFGQANLAFLTLEVRPSNTPAVALYEKNGFKEVGRRPNYYDDPKEDALLLTREFTR
ncbi:MAG: ribosomal protein S18-alanine N-acetyltransferase [Ruminiclostridium sp.]|jgi:ribosomal-protein-alanine N-acetyltransferase|nr:ribosomal protein S18-alanine N-acetyltransferase [Ruminiclostridium sp.]